MDEPEHDMCLGQNWWVCKTANHGNLLLRPYQDAFVVIWYAARVLSMLLIPFVCRYLPKRKTAYARAVLYPLDLGLVDPIAKIMEVCAHTGLYVLVPLVGKVTLIPPILSNTCREEFGPTAWPCVREAAESWMKGLLHGELKGAGYQVVVDTAACWSFHLYVLTVFGLLSYWFRRACKAGDREKWLKEKEKMAAGDGVKVMSEKDPALLV